MAIQIYNQKSNAWRDQYNPLRGMSLPKMLSLLDAGERGQYADLQWFYYFMERSDAMVFSVMQRRRAALLSCDWDISDPWGVLTNEMKRYEYQISPSGNITYGTPAGYHNDCVMALGLENHRRRETESCGRMLRVVGSGKRQGLRWKQRERVLMGLAFQRNFAALATRKLPLVVRPNCLTFWAGRKSLLRGSSPTSSVTVG